VAHLASHGLDGAGAFVAHLTAVALVEALLTSKAVGDGGRKIQWLFLGMATQKKDRKVGHLEVFSRKKHRSNQPTSWKYVFVFLGVTIHCAND